MDKHREELAQLLGAVREQLTPPPTWDRPAEACCSLSAFQESRPDQAAGLWFWGITPRKPQLRAEFSPCFNDLQTHTHQIKFWNELDRYRMEVGSFVEARRSLITHIDQEVKKRTPVPLFAEADTENVPAPVAYVTPEFSLSVYNAATGESVATSDLDYHWVREQESGVRELRWGRYSRKTLARLPIGNPRFERQLAMLHSALVNEVIRLQLGNAIISSYRGLVSQVPALRKLIDQSATRAVIAETTCDSCLAID
ncbi:MAG: hypothetical protein WD533_06785 [Dehalococcoidia bacterium]